LGGGQLGRMLTVEAKRMGYRVVTLEPFPSSPAGQVADQQIVAAYDDLRAIGELGARSDVVTYEFENIPLESIRALEADRRLVRPSAEVLRITQERLLEKAFVRECGIEVAPFAPVRSRDDVEAALTVCGLPAVMKTVLGGYDGKGQWVVRSEDEAYEAVAQARGRPLICEGFVAFDRELSIIATRNARDQIITFPVAENQHDHGVLATTIVPARIDRRIAARIREDAMTIARKLGIIGTFCIEFFQQGDRVLVNEIAPRVHNSGHYSLDATQISQYEAHVRAICDLPLVEPELLRPAVMVNILGTGQGDLLNGVSDLLTDPDLKLHLYGKTHAALRRKMGHFTIRARTLEEALRKAEIARKRLSWSRRETARSA
jgi:5-(carboxyamino)imidazole ribonucleotide synthase